MPVARTHSIALVGVEGHPVEIEADIQNGLPGLLLVGLPDTALREARDRIRAAIVNSREQWPQRRITVGLSPASLPKRGSGFDVGIAVAILSAAGSVPAAAIDGMAFLGELGLDGQLRPVRGVLPAAAAAAARGFRRVAVPSANEAEAALVPGLRVLSAPTLPGLLGWLRGHQAALRRSLAWMARRDRPAWVRAGGGRRVRAGRRRPGARRHRGRGRPRAAGRGRPGRRAPGAVGRRAVRSADGHRARPGRRAGPAHGPPGRGDLRRGRTSSLPARAAGRGQDDAGRADSHRAAPPRPGRGPRGHLDPLGGRRAPGPEPAADRAARSAPRTTRRARPRSSAAAAG